MMMNIFEIIKQLGKPFLHIINYYSIPSRHNRKKLNHYQTSVTVYKYNKYILFAQKAPLIVYFFEPRYYCTFIIYLYILSALKISPQNHKPKPYNTPFASERPCECDLNFSFLFFFVYSPFFFSFARGEAELLQYGRKVQ